MPYIQMTTTDNNYSEYIGY